MTTVCGYNCLVFSFHGNEVKVSSTVHSLLYDVPDKELETMICYDWKKVLVGIAKGFEYFHGHTKGSILHNDFKDDNVVIDVVPLLPELLILVKPALRRLSEKEIYKKIPSNHTRSKRWLEQAVYSF